MAQAALAEQHQNLADASKAWDQAIATAANSLQVAQFEFARVRAQILLNPDAAPDAAPKLEQSLKDPNLDSTLGAKLALSLAIVYDKLGRRPEALALLNKKLMLVDLDRQSLDALRIEYVLLDQEDPTTASAADDEDKLKNILDDWPDQGASDSDLLQWQEYALTILETGLADKIDPGPDDLAHLKTYIDKIAADPRIHPLRKQLYLLQTQLDLALQYYSEAAVAAQHVLDLSSGSDRDLARESAWRTLAFVAWNATPKNYSVAASNLVSLHKSLPDGPENKDVTALLADLYFLNGETTGNPDDYLNAAVYYTSLLDSPPLTGNVNIRSTLLVYAVESEIKANKLDDAMALLDSAVARYDNIQTSDRWSAEFDVLMALRDHNRSADAFNRLNHLLDANPGINLLPVPLLLRLRWLDASLAVNELAPSGAAKAKVLHDEAEAAQNNYQKNDLDAHELAAEGLLLEMRAAAQAGQPILEKSFSDQLQQNYSDTDAAVYAQFFTAHELAAQGKFVDAQSQMKTLADNFDLSDHQTHAGAEYAPFARYEQALDAESLDSTGSYANALLILKQFVDANAKNPLYADSSLLYYVRFEQGKLEFKSNDFQDAYYYFDNLKNLLTAKDRPLSDAMLADTLMARAQCLMNLAAESGLNEADQGAKRNLAMAELEGLMNKTELPPVDRVHAGVLLGALQVADQTTDDPAAADKAVETAKQTYYKVIDEFLSGDPEMARKVDLDPGGRYWMVECCKALGSLLAQQGHNDEALIVYKKMIYNHLATTAYIQTLIDALQPAPAAAPAVPPAAPPPATTTTDGSNPVK
jgi:hypothetical protein